MSITKSSLFVRLFLAVWLGLKNAAANSVLGRACDRLQGWVVRQAQGSAIWNFAWREGNIPKAWPGQHRLPPVYRHRQHPLRHL